MNEEKQQETAAQVQPEAVKAEEKTAEEQVAVNDAEAEAPAEEKKVYSTKKEVIDRLKELAHGDEELKKDELDHLKTTFYKLHIAERDADYKAYLDNGGDPEKYQVMPDDDEEVFKAEMGVIKEKKAKIAAQAEAEKEENLKKKLDIIEKIKTMVTSPEQANKSYQEFKKLQQEWKDIKAVPAAKANELWRTYQLYVEQFYDQLKLNSEAREYDFRKNLELKTKLCEAAEKLAEEPDVISAFHQLQKLHQEFREIGPVAKDLREEVWQRFKAASTVVNKRHQQHFEQLRSKEEDNLAQKTVLCEKLEEIIKREFKTAADYDKATKEIIALQADWKKIGFAPQKMNQKIFDRFRAGCDDFFGRKTQFFKDQKGRLQENADKKRELVEKAKALMDSTEWKSTTSKLIQLQKDWRAIGAAPKKIGDQLWAEFNQACNKFFEARNTALNGAYNEEKENLATKKSIVEQIKQLAEEAADDAQEKLQELTEKYNSIGHVPFKEKDNIYKAYRDALDVVYKKLNISASKRRLDNFKSNIKNMAQKGADALDNERARLLRQYDAIKSEVQTYENNLGFLNSTSKSGNSLIEEMNKKVQKLKDDLELVKQKIKAIDAENKEES